MIKWKRALSLIALGIVGAFALAELAIRIATGTVLVWGDPEVIDPVAGRTLRPGLSVRVPFKWFVMTAGDYGTRSNGNYQPPQTDDPTVAVGDSFTYGEDVGDNDTWPAQLERRTAHRVINGGCAGFGLDQTVLRAEQLAAIYAPDVLIVSFIPKDIERVEMSVYAWQPKPYFDIDGDGLRLHPVEVAPRSPSFEHIVSNSILLLILFHDNSHAGPEFVWPHHKGREVSCLLMRRLAALGSKSGSRIIVLAQPQEPAESSEDRELKDGVLKCAQENNLSTLDLFPMIDHYPLDQRGQLFKPDHGHMTAQGNALVAAAIADFLNTSN